MIELAASCRLRPAEGLPERPHRIPGCVAWYTLQGALPRVISVRARSLQQLDPLAFVNQQDHEVYLLIGAPDEFFPLDQVVRTYRALRTPVKTLEVVATMIMAGISEPAVPLPACRALSLRTVDRSQRPRLPTGQLPPRFPTCRVHFSSACDLLRASLPKLTNHSQSESRRGRCCMMFSYEEVSSLRTRCAEQAQGCDLLR